MPRRAAGAVPAARALQGASAPLMPRGCAGEGLSQPWGAQGSVQGQGEIPQPQPTLLWVRQRQGSPEPAPLPWAVLILGGIPVHPGSQLI